jgi:RHS repeat-associated protein
MRTTFILIFTLYGFFVYSQKTNQDQTTSKVPIGISIDPFDPNDPNDPIEIINPTLAGEVGSTNGELSVSLAGAAVYSIPIEVPKGINGIEPQVALNYNSQAGMGLAGYGWNISGVSMISRTGFRKDIDGYTASISNTISDNYALDGQRLIYKSGQIGSLQGAIFETEMYSNVKISAVGYQSGANGLQPDYFLVEYPDGSKAYYGLLIGSSFSSNSRTQIDYAITYWENPQGVRISYEYLNTNNKLYISKIKYGSVGTNSSINEINFVYKNKTRVEQIFIGGIEVKEDKILDKIKVYGNNVIYKNYLLTHQSYLNYERLIKFTVQNYNLTKSLSPLTFEYGTDMNNEIEKVAFKSSTIDSGLIDYNSLSYGDFDGNGEIDIIHGISSTNKLEAYLNIDDDLNDTSIILDDSANFQQHSFSNFNSIKYLDSNNHLNQKDALAYIKVYIENGVPKYKFEVVSINENNQFVFEYNREINIPYFEPNQQILKGDFNHDGLTDFIICKYQNSNQNVKLYYLNLDRRITTNYLIDLGEFNNIFKVHVNTGDFNGDGKTDIVAIRGENYNDISIYNLSLSNQFELLWKIDFPFIKSNNIILSEYVFGDAGFNSQGYYYNNSPSYTISQPPVFGDYNGDGKTDILLPGLDRKLLLSTGKGFVTNSISGNFPGTRGLGRIFSEDYNNDGKSDVISITSTRSETSFTYNINLITRNNNDVWTSKTKSFTKVRGNLNIDFDVKPLLVLPSKLRNGKSELLMFETKYLNAYPIEKSISYYVNNESFSDENKYIKSITSANNSLKTNIEYKNLINNNGNYTSNSLQEYYPNIDLQNLNKNNVVTKIEEITSNGLYRKQLFKFHGLVYNTEGLGSLGFRSTMRTNWFENDSEAISHITKYDITKRGAPIESFSVLGLSSPTLVLAPTEPFISKTLITYNFEDTAYVNPLLPNKVFKLFKSKVQNFNGLNNTSSIVSTTYNTTNNPTQTVEIIKSGTITEQISTTILGYDSLVSPYMVDRVISKNNTTSIFTNADTTTSEELFSYDKNLLKEIKKKGHNTVYVTEKNDFDVYGNIIKKTLVAPGLVDRVSNFEYDTSGRFLIKAINVEGLITAYTYDLSKGLMLTETQPSIDGFPLRTTYIYDTWGKKTKATNYLGNNETYEYQNTDAGVKVTTSNDNGNSSFVIYDPLGRKTQETVKNIDGSYSNVITYYDINNKPILKSEPFLGDLNFSEMETWSEMKYDVYGRLIQSNSLKSNNGEGKVKTYTYNGLTTIEFDGQKSKETIKNALDQIVTLTETPGGTVSYSYYANGNLKSTTTSGVTTTITQDGWGKKTELNDPSAGIYKYAYNNFGELTEEEVVTKGKTNYTIDDFGKTTAKTVVGIGGDTTNTLTTYTYNPATKQLSGDVFTDITNSYSITNTYLYDDYKRLIQTIEERTSYFKFQKDIVYDEFGRPEKEHFYAKDLTTNKLADKWVKHTYKNGYDYQIYNMTNSTTVSNLLWQTNTVNAQGKLLTAQMGNGIAITNTYDTFGFPMEFKHNKGTANIVTQTTTFDSIYGNLISRNNNLFGTWNETLTYDVADRLTSYKDVAGMQNQTYNDNGTIAANNIGAYAYTINGKPYTLSTITPTPNSVVLNYYSNRKQNITYNLHKSPVTITEQNKENIDFEYNNNKSRSVMYYGNMGATKNLRLMRKFYSADGTMEIKRNTSNSSNDFVIYIGGDGYSAPVILKSNGTTASTNFFFLHRDYQETIIAVTNSSGVIVEKRLFDVWGSLIKYANTSGITTVPTTTTGLFIDRGYTGHEHLLGVGLINMNGRIYDNKLHRFLQPDNNIQDPYNIQNFNRYGYVMNNPTKYTDQSGEFWQYLFAALFNSYASGVQASNGQLNPFNWNSTAWTNAALGAVSSVATQVATNSFNSYIDNYNNKPEFNNFGGENPVEEHRFVALKSDSHLITNDPENDRRAFEVWRKEINEQDNSYNFFFKKTDKMLRFSAEYLDDGANFRTVVVNAHGEQGGRRLSTPVGMMNAKQLHTFLLNNNKTYQDSFYNGTHITVRLEACQTGKDLGAKFSLQNHYMTVIAPSDDIMNYTFGNYIMNNGKYLYFFKGSEFKQ